MTSLPDGIHIAGKGLINFYVIEEGGKLTLVDTGLPGDWGRLRRWLQSDARRASDIEAILVTHAHRDHIGGAARVQRESPAVVRLHHADFPYATGRDSRSARASSAAAVLRLGGAFRWCCCGPSRTSSRAGHCDTPHRATSWPRTTARCWTCRATRDW